MVQLLTKNDGKASSRDGDTGARHIRHPFRIAGDTPSAASHPRRCIAADAVADRPRQRASLGVSLDARDDRAAAATATRTRSWRADPIAAAIARRRCVVATTNFLRKDLRN
jgi:hypothetical protein